MRSFFRNFKKILMPSSSSLNMVKISQANLLHNLTLLQTLHPEQKVFPVLKSNAYGHGLKEVCQILNGADGVEYLCVDSYPERQIVRDYTNHKALIIGETLPENYRLYDTKRTALAVYNTQTIRYLGDLGHPFKIHLFLNTGMNREGLDEGDLEDILMLLKKYPQLQIEGVMSHLATADEPDRTQTDEQIALYKHLYAKIVAAGHTPLRRHLGNSAGYAKLSDPLFTAARTGYVFYGYNPFEKNDPHFAVYANLKPALSVTSTIVSTHQLPAGAKIGYGATYTTSQPETICTIPFGYMEGLPRSVSNTAKIRRDDHYLQAAGRISMNLSSFDAHQLAVQTGDTVEIISMNPDTPNSLYALATAAGTIPYELLVKLDRNTRRIIV